MTMSTADDLIIDPSTPGWWRLEALYHVENVQGFLAQIKGILAASGLPAVYLFDKKRARHELDSEFALAKLLGYNPMQVNYSFRPGYREKFPWLDVWVINKDEAGTKRVKIQYQFLKFCDLPFIEGLFRDLVAVRTLAEAEYYSTRSHGSPFHEIVRAMGFPFKLHAPRVFSYPSTANYRDLFKDECIKVTRVGELDFCSHNDFYLDSDAEYTWRFLRSLKIPALSAPSDLAKRKLYYEVRKDNVSEYLEVFEHHLGRWLYTQIHHHDLANGFSFLRSDIPLSRAEFAVTKLELAKEGDPYGHDFNHRWCRKCLRSEILLRKNPEDCKGRPT